MSWPCDLCEVDTPTEHGLKIHRTKMHGVNGAGPDDLPLDDVSPFADPTPAPVAPAETPPKEPGWRERIWGNDPKQPKPPRPKKTGERKPRVRRLSTEGIWTTAWTAGGMALCRSGADIPVGNCLQFQAPIVGEILDQAVAGTVLDKLLQPIAGGGERLKKVTSVLAMPILVGALERSPGAAPVLEPLLRQAIREHLVAMAPVIKARQKAEEQYKKALVDLGMDAGDDPIDSVIDAIFPHLVNAEQNGAAYANAAP